MAPSDFAAAGIQALVEVPFFTTLASDGV